MTVFVNERRGGPMLPDQLAHAGILESWSKVKWSKGFTLVRRGVLTAAGAIPMPSGLDTRLESRWDVKAGAGDPLQVEGGHLVEVVLDNRNGEAEALLGTLMNSPQLSWQVRFEDPNMKLLLEVLHDVHDVRLYADLASVDALRIKLRINVDEANAANFNIIPMMLPAIKDTLKQEYGLTLEGDADWDAKEEAYVGDFRISGLDAMVRSKLNPAGPAPAG